MLIKTLVLFIFGVISSGAIEDEVPCINNRTKTPGVCKLAKDCESIWEDIEKDLKYTKCDDNLVCCDNKIEPRFNSPLSLHEKKCHEYQSAVYDHVYSLGLAIGAERQKIKVDKCGHKSIPLIVGGEFAKVGEFPHMALVGYEAPESPGQVSWACGGALISERFILTAGHCLNSSKYGYPRYVRLGELDVLSTNDGAQPEDYNVDQVLFYPSYTRKSKYNDIGLIRLNRDVKFTPMKRPACLPSEFEGDESRAIATGWGTVQWSGSSSSQLQKVTLDKFSYEECNNIYLTRKTRLPDGIKIESQMCAGSKTESKDTCQGDSGGPLQVYNKNEYCMYTTIGITSFGHECGIVGIPGVYTRVYNYIDWIERTIWPGE